MTSHRNAEDTTQLDPQDSPGLIQMPSFELRLLISACELSEYVACYFDSFDNPVSPFVRLLAPPRGEDIAAQEYQLFEYSVRQWLAHNMDPTSYIVKVVDIEDGDKIVGGAKWNIYLEDPFRNGIPDVSAFWLLTGPSKQYTEPVLKKLLRLRARDKPYIRTWENWRPLFYRANILYSLPSHVYPPKYRMQGVGHLMMNWGTYVADNLNLEIYIESTPLGSLLHSKHGCRLVDMADLIPPHGTDDQEDDPELKALRNITKDLRAALLRRPVHASWNFPEELCITPKGDLDKNVWKSAKET